LIHLSDEALVRTIQENQLPDWCPPAATLLQRYQGWIDQLLRRLGRQYGLSAVDLEDARQDAVFGLGKAIRRYDTLQSRATDVCSFRTFLYRVLSNQLTDAVRRRRRERARLPQAGAPPLLDWAGNPVNIAEENELRFRLEQIRDQLEPREADLLDGILSGRRLRSIAASLGLSYDAVKRRWRKLRRHLSIRLRDWEPDEGGKCSNLSAPVFCSQRIMTV
jgi:RNA polymerase sigma factor (sigma-70 family)